MLPSCTASQLRSLAHVDTNHILKHHQPLTRLDGEVVSVFAYGLCTDETVLKLASLTSTQGEKLSHKPIANDKCEFEYIYSIDLPIGWGLDGSISEYVYSQVQMAGPGVSPLSSNVAPEVNLVVYCQVQSPFHSIICSVSL